MKVISLGYHDVVDPADEAGDDPLRKCPGRYALSRPQFREHLHAIRDSGTAVSTVKKLDIVEDCAVLLTFDDGAIGAYDAAAAELELLGWRGHFFITTDWIGKPGFMCNREIRDLHRRGHVIGSHTCSHPSRMSSLSRDQLMVEWTTSCRILAEVLGEPVEVASVSDGYYSRKVGQSASDSGIRYLFNSEPTARPAVVSGCMVLGRYPVFSTTSAALSGSIAAQDRLPRWKQAAAWQAKKLLKSIGGEAYLSVRNAVLSRSHSKQV